MNQILMYGTFGALGLVVVCLVAGMVQVAKKGKSSVWMNRGVYVFGLLAVALNLIRMAVILDGYKGTMIFANAIALICILVAFVRAERAYKCPDAPEEESEK